MDPTLDLRPFQLAVAIGVDHKIQHFVEDIAPSDPRNKLRLRYLDFLRDLTGRYPVHVIYEETKLGEESIAETLADQGGLRFRNIQMPQQRRAELGIPLGTPTSWVWRFRRNKRPNGPPCMNHTWLMKSSKPSRAQEPPWSSAV